MTLINLVCYTYLQLTSIYTCCFYRIALCTKYTHNIYNVVSVQNNASAYMANKINLSTNNQLVIQLHQNKLVRVATVNVRIM